jgi:superfamily II DNA or RNA helicase
MNSTHPYAPGSRVLIRDAEWLVRRVEPTTTGHWALAVVGVSELVRNREAVFISNAEKRIDILDPAATILVPDTSGKYLDSRLYLESLLRNTSPTDNKIYLGHRAAMDLLPFQLDPALQALSSPRQRILMADSVGLGKTLEAGILLSELIVRGKAKRILVVAIKSMLTQFQKELWARFAIPLVRLDSIGLQRVRSTIPTHHNPFNYFDRTIISIDTLKQDNEFRIHLENAYWDVIVIDEAHNVARRGGGASQRSELAQLIAGRSDALIMLSATPHDGRRESFASLMNMLDATAIANDKDYGPNDIKGLYVRRFKKDIKAQVAAEFPERTIVRIKGPQAPSITESAAYESLSTITFSHIDRSKGGTMLFKTLLEKSLFSSPSACSETISHRIALIKNETAAGDECDILKLLELKTSIDAITVDNFSKYCNLVSLIRDRMKWRPSAPDDRIVIFTERIATLAFLHANLAKDLKLKDNQIAELSGNLNDMEQQRIVEEFGQETSTIRLLLATDIASEGINLHYLSHRLIHFDIPWSLMVFQQRNGRIDRYGQEKRPEIYYMMTDTANERLKGDLHILDLLISKDDEAQSSIGDPSAFLNLYDQEKEEKAVADAIESGGGAGELENKMKGFDPFDIVLGTGKTTSFKDSREFIASMPSLFPDDYTYTKTALQRLQHAERVSIQWQPFDATREIAITINPELEARYHFLPREIRSADEQLLLCADPAVLQKEIKAARKEENAWPKKQYLWSIHPVVQWLNDRVLSSFGRHQAPIIRISTLKKNETIFLVSGQIPNRRGQALIQRWLGVCFNNGAFNEIISLEEALKKSQINEKEFANPQTPFATAPHTALLPEVVKRGNEYLMKSRKEFLETTMPAVNKKLADLEALEAKHEQQLELDFVRLFAVSSTHKQSRLNQIKRAFADYRAWIKSTLEIEEHGHIVVVLVMTGDDNA